MTVIVRLPALSPTMETGTIARWVKQEGDSVKEGDVLAEIETDKATMEVECATTGTLAKILLNAGEAGKVAQSIAIIMQEGDSAEDLEKAIADASVAYGASASAPSVTEKKADAPRTTTPSAPATSPSPVADTAPTERVFATPLARRIASEKSISLSTIKGTGPHGRIIKGDVESALRTSSVASSTAPMAVDGDAPFTDVPHSSMRKTIARRLTESKQQVPHFYVSMDYDVQQLLQARSAINASADGSYKISVNDFIIKASALALRDVPEVNAYWSADSMRLFHRSDVAVAVATKTGLITPIIRGAELKGIAVISSEMKTLVKKAMEGKLKPEEYQGGGFSISNMGMFGVNSFLPIVNPPQAAILGVGAVLERPVVRHGAVVISSILTLTLAADHRVVDGAKAAEFMNALKRYLENPVMFAL